MKYISRALISLGVNEFSINFDGVPSTEAEFNEAFTKYDSEGVGTQGISQISPITWDQISAKALELENAEPTNMLRRERNRLLQETDWWELPSQAPMSTERTNYRQALRDITDTYNSLETVVWPTKPS